MQQNLHDRSKHQPNVQWTESTIKPGRKPVCRTKSNTAAPKEHSTEPRTSTRTRERAELSSLARSELQNRTCMREHACSMASMVAWSCCGSGLPPGKPCMVAAAAPDRAWRGVGSPRSPRVWPPASGQPTWRGEVELARGLRRRWRRREQWMGGWLDGFTRPLGPGERWKEATQPACFAGTVSFVQSSIQVLVIIKENSCKILEYALLLFFYCAPYYRIIGLEMVQCI